MLQMKHLLFDFLAFALAGQSINLLIKNGLKMVKILIISLTFFKIINNPND